MGLRNITIPDSVEDIGQNAFSGCTGLTSITIPKKIKKLAFGVFCHCSGLVNITIPNSVTNIESNAFSGCSGLTSITVPDGVTRIESCTFWGCSSLVTVTLPDSIRYIEDWAFFGCTGLKSIIIPKNVISIGEHAFSGCTGITGITIPDRVENIDKYAFYGCSALKSIIIPNSVEKIGDRAFFGTSPDFIIYTIENSTAHDYALSNDIKYYLTKITRYIPSPNIDSITKNNNGTVKITLQPTVNYEYKCNDGEWQKSNVFDNLPFGKNYKFYQRLEKTNKNVESSPSDAKIIHIKKANTTILAAPDILSKTAFSISLKKNAGCEYKMDDGEWQSSNVFTGLKEDTEYTFYQRIAETENSYASESSAPLKIKTDKAYISGDLDGNDEVTDADAEYLLMHTFFPDEYPVNQNCDFNNDGAVTDADAEYLLMFTFFPEEYPIN